MAKVIITIIAVNTVDPDYLTWLLIHFGNMFLVITKKGVSTVDFLELEYNWT